MQTTTEREPPKRLIQLRDAWLWYMKSWRIARYSIGIGGTLCAIAVAAKPVVFDAVPLLRDSLAWVSAACRGIVSDLPNFSGHRPTLLPPPLRLLTAPLATALRLLPGFSSSPWQLAHLTKLDRIPIVRNRGECSGSAQQDLSALRRQVSDLAPTVLSCQSAD